MTKVKLQSPKPPGHGSVSSPRPKASTGAGGFPPTRKQTWEAGQSRGRRAYQKELTAEGVTAGTTSPAKGTGLRSVCLVTQVEEAQTAGVEAFSSHLTGYLLGGEDLRVSLERMAFSGIMLVILLPF